MQMQFTFEPSKPDVILELRGIAYLSLSKTPGDEDECFVLGEAWLRELGSDMNAVLAKLGYKILGRDGHPLPPSVPAYHLHLEGDLVFDCVATAYECFGSLP